MWMLRASLVTTAPKWREPKWSRKEQLDNENVVLPKGTVLAIERSIDTKYNMNLENNVVSYISQNTKVHIVYDKINMKLLGQGQL